MTKAGSDQRLTYAKPGNTVTDYLPDWTQFMANIRTANKRHNRAIVNSNRRNKPVADVVVASTEPAKADA